MKRKLFFCIPQLPGNNQSAGKAFRQRLGKAVIATVLSGIASEYHSFFRDNHIGSPEAIAVGHQWEETGMKWKFVGAAWAVFALSTPGFVYAGGRVESYRSVLPLLETGGYRYSNNEGEKGNG